MTKKLALSAMMTVFALALSYLEHLIPLGFGVPGIKLGLANAVVLLVMMLLGIRYAFTVDLLRILLTALLFGGVSGFLYSFAGGMLSFVVMLLLWKSQHFGTIGMSVAGAAAHSVGQIAVAAWMMSNLGLFYYLPILLFVGIVTGSVIGIVTHLLYHRLEHIFSHLPMQT